MGVNSITKIAPTMANKSGITVKITNRSLRKTLCQILSLTHVDPTVIIQLSGHKNVNSVLNYATADMDLQKDMSEILTRQDVKGGNVKKWLTVVNFSKKTTFYREHQI